MTERHGDNGSAAKSTGYSYRGPVFTQHPYGGSQPSVTPAAGDQVPTECCGYQEHTQCADMHAGKTFIHIRFSK